MSNQSEQCCHDAAPVTPPGMARASPWAQNNRWTCPMHSEVIRDRSGGCPKCGMALESKTESFASAKAEWTCPMHPGVLSDRPGHCPKCGMALELQTPTLANLDDNLELKDFTRRFWRTLPLTIVVTAIAMF